MRILILTSNSPDTIEKGNVDLKINANFLTEKGHNVYLVGSPGEKILSEKFQHLPLGSKKIDKKGLDSLLPYFINTLVFSKQLLQNVKKISPDVICCVGSSSLYKDFLLGVFMSKLFGIPLITEWRGSDLLLKNSSWRTYIKKLILKKSTMNFVQSKDMLKKALDIAPDSKTIILPVKGIDLDKFNSFSVDSSKRDDKQRILYVGRLHKIKGLDYLIKAFRIVNEKHPKSELIIVGEGDIKDNLVELAKKEDCLDRIEFVGEVDHQILNEYYNRSDILVLPSFSEGLSNVIMEAMACSLPVVATNVGGNPELVKHGRGGFLVQSKSANELHDAMEKLIDNPGLIEKMGVFNAEYVKRYDQEKVLEKKERLINNISELNE